MSDSVEEVLQRLEVAVALHPARIVLVVGLDVRRVIGDERLDQFCEEHGVRWVPS